MPSSTRWHQPVSQLTRAQPDPGRARPSEGPIMFNTQHRLARTTTGIAGLSLLTLCLVDRPRIGPTGFRTDRPLASTSPTASWPVWARSTSWVTTSPATACRRPPGSVSSSAVPCPRLTVRCRGPVGHGGGAEVIVGRLTVGAAASTYHLRSPSATRPPTNPVNRAGRTGCAPFAACEPPLACIRNPTAPAWLSRTEAVMGVRDRREARPRAQGSSRVRTSVSASHSR